MKSIIDSWHPVHSGVRRGLFADAARELRDAEFDEDPVLSETVERAVALLCKNSKSLPKTRAALEEIEARLKLTVNYQERAFDRTDF